MGKKNRKIMMAIVLAVTVCLATGCQKDRERQEELCLREGYRAIMKYLQDEETGAELCNNTVSIAEKGSESAELVYGSFTRIGSREQEVSIYSMATHILDDPAGKTYVSSLQEERALSITEELCKNIPVSYKPMWVLAGKKTYFPVRCFTDAKFGSGSTDGVERWDDTSGSYAYVCIPADLSVEYLDQRVIKPEFSRVSVLKKESSFDEKALELLEDVSSFELKYYDDPETNYNKLQSDEIFELMDMLIYEKSVWRNQLHLVIQLTDADFTEKTAELVAWVKSIGVAAVTFYDAEGIHCWTVANVNLIQKNKPDRTPAEPFRYPCFQVSAGDNPDEPIDPDEVRYFNYETLEEVFFYFDSSEERYRLRGILE